MLLLLTSVTQLACKAFDTRACEGVDPITAGSSVHASVRGTVIYVYNKRE